MVRTRKMSKTPEKKPICKRFQDLVNIPWTAQLEMKQKTSQAREAASIKAKEAWKIRHCNIF